MWGAGANVYRLGVKELAGVRYDVVLIVLIVYAFTYAVYVPAKSARTDLADASVAVVDEDHSELSRRITASLRRPFVRTPGQLSVAEIDRALDAGQYTFVLNIPPEFQTDVVRGRSTAVQVNVDATAMSQAGSGVRYILNAVTQELNEFARGQGAPDPEVRLVTRVKYNPNMEAVRFAGVVQVINNITMLAIFLAGAAVIREREHGTFEHLLVMPVRPIEIMLAKVWATGLVVAGAATVSLLVIVRWALDVPLAGSVPLFVAGQLIYLFAVTSLGIFLATLARSMPQFALLGLSVYMVLNLLSGGTTPLDSMPVPFQKAIQLSPTTHFVSSAEAILFRGAGLDVVWRDFVAIAGIGAVLFTGALLRFRRTVTEAQS
jgi:ABC-2 type transport system permease protein